MICSFDVDAQRSSPWPRCVGVSSSETLFRWLEEPAKDQQIQNAVTLDFNQPFEMYGMYSPDLGSDFVSLSALDNLRVGWMVFLASNLASLMNLTQPRDLNPVASPGRCRFVKPARLASAYVASNVSILAVSDSRAIAVADSSTDGSPFPGALTCSDTACIPGPTRRHHSGTYHTIYGTRARRGKARSGCSWDGARL